MVELIVTIIVLSVCLVACVIALLIFLYQQLLMTNEINKRLLLLSENSLAGEKNAIDDLNSLLLEKQEELQSKFGEDENRNTQTKSVYPDEEEEFNPHEALDSLR